MRETLIVGAYSRARRAGEKHCWREVALGNFRSELTAHQLSCLDAIDSNLSELTRTGPESWTEDTVRESGDWRLFAPCRCGP